MNSWKRLIRLDPIRLRDFNGMGSEIVKSRETCERMVEFGVSWVLVFWDM